MRSMVEWPQRVGLLIEQRTHSLVPFHHLAGGPHSRSGKDLARQIGVRRG